jgi:hypothetical protein
LAGGERTTAITDLPLAQSTIRIHLIAHSGENPASLRHLFYGLSSRGRPQSATTFHAENSLTPLVEIRVMSAGVSQAGAFRIPFPLLFVISLLPKCDGRERFFAAQISSASNDACHAQWSAGMHRPARPSDAPSCPACPSQSRSGQRVLLTVAGL